MLISCKASENFAWHCWQIPCLLDICAYKQSLINFSVPCWPWVPQTSPITKQLARAPLA